MLYAVLPLRRLDRYGAGHYGASRDEGKRKHLGVDFAAWPGTVILSPVMGQVTKLGYPYADDLSWRYVQVTAGDRNHRLFYVKPCVRIGQWVTQGCPLGNVQDLRYRYEGITPHVHYEIETPEGDPVEPTVQKD